MRKPTGTDAKKKVSPRGKRMLNFEKKEKLPLFGKSLYLDIKNQKQAKQIKADLGRLGASVEEFLSKDINYVITSQPRPKSERNDNHGKSADSLAAVSTPSPFNCGPSPLPAGGKPTSTVTRGKAMVQQVAGSKQTNTVIENAEKWNVRIVGLNAALKWIQKELAKLPTEQKSTGGQDNRKPSSSKVRKLKSPFLKFEAVNLQYKAIHQQLDSWPHVNVDTPKGTCPFDGSAIGKGEQSREERGDRIGLYLPDLNLPATPVEQKNKSTASDEEDAHGKKPQPKKMKSIVGGVRIMTAGDIRRRKEIKRLQERKKGYCECCQIKYENLDKHLMDNQHKAFIRDKRNYRALDTLIKTGPNEATFLQRVLLNHCSKNRGKTPKLANTNDSDDKINMTTEGKVLDVSGQDKLNKGSDRKSQNKRISESIGSVTHSRCIGSRRTEVCGNVDIKDNIPTQENKGVETRKKGGVENKSPKHSNSKREIKGEELNDLKSKSNTGADNIKEKIRRSGEECSVQMGDVKLNEVTSDTCMLESHYVPTRTRNFLLIQHMSPKRVSWARQKNSSEQDVEPSTANKQGNRKAVKNLSAINLLEKKNDNDNLLEMNSKLKESKVESNEVAHSTRSMKILQGCVDNFKETFTNSIEPEGEKEPELEEKAEECKVTEEANNLNVIENFKANSANEDKKSLPGNNSNNIETKEKKQSVEQRRIMRTRQNVLETNLDNQVLNHSPPSIVISSEQGRLPNMQQQDCNLKSERTTKRLATNKKKDHEQNSVKKNQESGTSIHIVCEDDKQMLKTRQQHYCEQTIKTSDIRRRKKFNQDQNMTSSKVKEEQQQFASEASNSPMRSRLRKHEKEKNCGTVSRVCLMQASELNKKSDSSPRLGKKIDEIKCSEMKNSQNQTNGCKPEALGENVEESFKNILSKSLNSRSHEVAIKNGSQILSSKLGTVDKELNHIDGTCMHSQNDGEQNNQLIGINKNIEQVTYFIDKIHRLRCTERRRLSVDSRVQDIYKGVDSDILSSEYEASMINGSNSERKRTPSPVFNKSPKMLKRKNVHVTNVTRSDLKSKTSKVDNDVSVYNISSDEVSQENSCLDCKSPGSGISNTPRSYRRKKGICKEVIGRSSKQNKLDIRRGKKNCQPERSKLSTSTSLRERSKAVLMKKQYKEYKENNHTVEQSQSYASENLANDSVIKQNKFVAIKKLELKDLTIVQGNVNRDELERKLRGVHDKLNQRDAAKQEEKKTARIHTPKRENKKKSHQESKQSKSFSLTWCHAKGSTPKQKSKKVKLNKSWSLISDRSVVRLFDSEPDQDENFEGFNPEDVVPAHSSLGSEISYVETNEVEFEENSDHEWTFDTEEDDPNGNVEVDEDDFGKVAEIVQHNLFSSPGKASDASWEEACMGYIESQLSFNKQNSSLLNSSLISPLKHSAAGLPVSPNLVHMEQVTPKRKKIGKRLRSTNNQIDTGIEKVDEEIEFNHWSPQKVKTFVNPGTSTSRLERNEEIQDSEIIISSSPVVEKIISTSTPYRSRPTKRRLNHDEEQITDVLECLHALSSCSGNELRNSQSHSYPKRRKIVKKVPELKKTCNINVTKKRHSGSSHYNKRKCVTGQVIKQPKR